MFLYICSYIFVISYCSAFNSVLNIDEIGAVHYNINILSVPILKDQDSKVETLKLVNKYGQEYVCDIPTIQVDVTDLKKSKPSAEDLIDFEELLKPMETAPCLVQKFDWWTYEFCYGSIIRQYHVQDKKILGNGLILGQYNAEYNVKHSSESINKLQNYHTQLYVNGSRCDVNGNQRQTEVRFICDNSISDYIKKVDETESCHYLLIIGTPRVCHHPYLQSQMTKFPYKLNCAPTVTAQQLEIYQKVQAVKIAKAEELKEKNSAENETQKGELKNVSVESQFINDKTSEKDGLQHSSFPKDKKLIFTKESIPQMETEELPIRNNDMNKDDRLFVENYLSNGPLNKPDYMRNIFKKVFETIKEEMEIYRAKLIKNNLQQDTYFKDIFSVLQKRVNDLSDTVIKENYDQIYEDLTFLLGINLESMVTLIKSRYPIAGDLQEQMLSRVAEIKELINDLLTDDETQRVEKLQKILKAIINTLVLLEKQSQTVKERLKSLETSLKKQLEVIFNSDGPSNADETERSLDSELLEFSARGSSLPNTEDVDKVLRGKTSVQNLKGEPMTEFRKTKLEQKIKEKLKKFGWEGQKIEVQIVPAYMTDDKYPSLVALSTKDEEILFRIINSNEDEVTERKRYSNLVKNYNFNLEDVLSSQEQSPTKDGTESRSTSDLPLGNDGSEE